MSLDLERALHDVVDVPADPRALGGPGGLVALRIRVRRRRAARAAGRAAVGAGAACAVGAGALAWDRGGDGGPLTERIGDEPAAAWAPGGPLPVEPSDSALCGVAVAALTGDRAADAATLTLGLPGVDVDAGDLVGRSVGPDVPAWLDLSPGSGDDLAGEPSVVLVSDEQVVAVAAGVAAVIAADDESAAVRVGSPAASTAPGTLRACPGTAHEGLAGAVPPAGEYTLRAVAGLGRVEGGTVRQLVSQPVPVTLLPEQALIAPGTPGLPADFPLAEVPLVGSRVLTARTAAIDGWSVTVEVAGDDALQRAADALGLPTGSPEMWQRLTAAEAELTAVQTRAAEAAAEQAGMRASLAAQALEGTRFTNAGTSSTGLTASVPGLDIEVRAQTGPGGADTLVYRVTRS